MMVLLFQISKMRDWLALSIPILVNIIQASLASTYSCNNCGYSEIPTSLMSNETTHVYLKGNRIASIQRASLATLTNIEQLYVDRNLLTDVEFGSFSGLKITHMDLSHNQLTSVPDVEPLASTLWSLDLRNNGITTIQPYTFTNFTALNRIYFLDNLITSLTDFALDTPHANFYHVHIARNGLSALSDLAFARMNGQHIFLDENALTEIPCFDETRKIRYLYLRKNPITKIPSGCGQWWSKLEILYLEQTRLMSLDGITKYTPTLRRLRVDVSDLTLTDQTFKDMSVLQAVMLKNVNLFPQFHSSKSSLVSLELEGKYISCIDEAWLDGMNKVVTFILRQTSLELLPSHGCSNNTYENHTTLGYFKSLKTMIINDGLLLQLPNLTSLGSNSSLVTLQLRSNKIPSVPCFPDTFKLNNLVNLDLLSNKIEYICNLDFAPNIKYLLLSGNSLVDLLFIETTSVPLLSLQRIQIESITIDSLSDALLRVIPNIAQVKMSSNDIKLFPNIKLIASGVEHIELHRNSIPDVPCSALDKMEKLNYLNLDTNMITYVCPTLLSFTPKLTILVLKNNKLLEIADLRVPAHLETTRVLLNGNPFRCLPSMCWMLFVPQASSLQLEVGNAQCKDSEDKGKQLIPGLTTECTCKYFNRYRLSSLPTLTALICPLPMCKKFHR